MPDIWPNISTFQKLTTEEHTKNFGAKDAHLTSFNLTKKRILKQ